MATIEFKPEKKFKYWSNLSVDVGIGDWRTISYDEKNNETTVVIFDCNEIVIKDLSLDEFHEINYCNKTVKKYFTIYRCHLQCNRCNGSGTTDWISKVVKEKPLLDIKPFDRDPKGRILALQLPNCVIYASSPKLISSLEICSDCYGSGLNHVKQYKIIDEFFIENC